MTPQQKIQKARASLILGHAFYATILCSLEMSQTTEAEAEDIPTMATNGDFIKWNPKFVDELSFDEVKFVLCHEVLHNVLEHPSRLGARDATLFNQAADYLINEILTNDRCGTMPTGEHKGLLNPQLVQAGGETTDGIYKILEQMPNNGNGGGGQGQQGGSGQDPQGGWGNDVQPAPGGKDSANSQTQRAKMKVLVGQARQAAKMCGQMGASLERLIGEIMEPQVDWRSAVRSFIACKANDFVTWARPNRRFLSQGIYMPTRTGERVGTMVVAVDCSGSVADAEVAEFAAEIHGIKRDLRPKELHVIYFHSEVSKHDTFTDGDDLVIKPNGTGGTAFSPIFRFLDDEGVSPETCVVLTDLCCSDFGPEPDYPVMWVSNCAKDAPWGEVILMRRSA